MLNLEEAIHTLNIPNDSNDIQVLSTFKNLYEESNRVHRKELIEAKNLLIRSIIEKQLHEQNFFNIEVPPNFNACDTCKGTGEIYRLEVISVIDKCSFCNGSGIHTEKCKRCNGTGEIQGRKCPTCKGSKIYIFRKNSNRQEDRKCEQCGGSGDVTKIIKTGRINIHTTCTVCRGSGMKKVRKRTLSNPVLTKDVGKIIKEQL